MRFGIVNQTHTHIHIRLSQFLPKKKMVFFGVEVDDDDVDDEDRLHCLCKGQH